MNDRLIKISSERYTWHNCTSNIVVTPLRFFYPETREDIREIVKTAESGGLRVRAVGSGHSFSEVARGKDFLLSMKKLDKLDYTPTDCLKPAWKDNNLVNIEAGIILKELNRKLDNMGLALPNMGTIDIQTLSGALLTGTHGTGIKKPAFPDIVRSIRLVGSGGKLYQIEPSDGMTDKSLHDQQYDGAIELIQEDRTFYSAVLSFGGMGIVYEVTMEVKPTFWMKEKRYLEKWSELKKQFESGEFIQLVEDTDFVAFRINPYKVKGDHTCAIVNQSIVKPDDAPTGWGARRRNFLSSLGANMEFLIESAIRRINRKPENAKGSIEMSLKFTKDARYYAKSFKVLYQSGLSIIRHGISSEFAFPAKSDKIVEVLEGMLEIAEYNVKVGGLYQSAPISARFVMPSKAFLSSAYDRPTVYVEVPMLHNTPGDFEILERYQQMMIKLGGIPHWGKVNNNLYENHDLIKEKFPMREAWIDERNKADPKGTFLNDFIIKMGLDKK